MKVKAKINSLKAINLVIWVVSVFSTGVAIAGSPERIVAMPGKDGKPIFVKIYDNKLDGIQPFGSLGVLMASATVGYVLTHPLRDLRKSIEASQISPVSNKSLT
jgi:Zn-dependent protease